MFVQAAHYRVGRPAGTPSVIVIHTTESPASAVGIASFFHNQPANDPNPTSAHAVVDAHQVIGMVKASDTAYHCGPTGNSVGYGVEHCGFAHWTTADWSSPAALSMLHLSAQHTASVCKTYAIPAIKLNAAGLKAGRKGFAGHVDVTNAWHESTHTDPGTAFPWVSYLLLVQTYLNPPAPTPPPIVEDTDMFVYYVREGDTTGAGYIRFSSGRTHVTYAEATGRTAAGEAVKAVHLPATDPFWTLLTLP